MIGITKPMRCSTCGKIDIYDFHLFSNGCFNYFMITTYIWNDNFIQFHNKQHSDCEWDSLREYKYVVVMFV